MKFQSIIDYRNESIIVPTLLNTYIKDLVQSELSMEGGGLEDVISLCNEAYTRFS